MIKKDSINLDLINSSLNEHGFIVVENFFSESFKNEIKDFVVSKIKDVNKDRFSLNENQLKNTIIGKMINAPDFLDFCNNLEEKNKIKNLQFNSHYLINYSKKKKKTDEKFSFHFDAFINTIIIPINIHNESSDNFSMSLEIIPNLRNLTNSILINLFQKIIFQNRLFKFFSNSFLFKLFFKSKNIKIKFNDILIFNGFRTLHSHSISISNTEKEKARLIIHVFNPFYKNRLDQIIFKNIQNQRVNKN